MRVLIGKIIWRHTRLSSGRSHFSHQLVWINVLPPVASLASDVESDVELPAPVEGVGFSTFCTDEKAIGIRITLKIF